MSPLRRKHIHIPNLGRRHKLLAASHQMQQPPEIILDSGGRGRASIPLRHKAVDSVNYGALFEDDVPEFQRQYGYWAPFLAGSLADTPVNARKLAREAIQPDATDA